uniref:Uncharacterized protein n=1 Tax=Romanomermis culicivorax TaxID=13658 RepID=A0A915KQC0_ROMCU
MLQSIEFVTFDKRKACKAPDKASLDGICPTIITESGSRTRISRIPKSLKGVSHRTDRIMRYSSSLISITKSESKKIFNATRRKDRRQRKFHGVVQANFSILFNYKFLAPKI